MNYSVEMMKHLNYPLKIKEILIVCLVIFLSCTKAASSTFTWVGGDVSMPNCWADANNWDKGSMPAIGDDVIIPATGNNPYLTLSVSVNSLNITGLNASLTLDGTHNLTVTGSVILSTLSSVLYTAKSTLYVGGSLSGNGILNLNGNGTAVIGGDMTMGSLIAGSGVKSMVIFNGTNQNVIGSYAFNNVQVGSTNGTTVNFLENETINVALSGYGTLNCGNDTLNLTGDMTLKYFNADSGTVNLTGYIKAQSQVINGYSFYNLSINNTKTYLSGNVSISHNLNFISGNIQLRSYNLTIFQGAQLTWNSISTLDYTSGYVVTCGSGHFTMNASLGGTVFPVGYSLSEYNPVTITSSALSSVFDLRVYDGVTDKYGSPVTSNAVSVTWLVVPHTSVSSVILNPQWTDGSNFDAAQELSPFSRDNALVNYRSNLSYPSQWMPTQSGGFSNGSDPYSRLSGSISMVADSSYYIYVGGAGISALPVSLISLDASYQAGSVNLNWATASEINNNYFQVERSTNGVDWKTIGIVDGHGTSQTRNNYAAVDNLSDIIASGPIYYRLKQVDFNDGFSYSDIRTVDIMLKAFAVQTYPNPANQSLNVDWTGTEAGNSQLRLVNTNGVQMYTNTITGNGALHQQINMEGFPSGSYILEVINGSMTASKIIYKE